MSLERFVQAQKKGDSYAHALAELKAGRKTGHWIWWVFPQLKGLGSSHNSTFYGLDDEAEAAAYLEHPILGARYRECVDVVHDHLCKRVVDPLVLMGSDIDVLKLESSLQLFLKVAPSGDTSLRTRMKRVAKLLGSFACIMASDPVMDLGGRIWGQAVTRQVLIPNAQIMFGFGVSRV